MQLGYIEPFSFQIGRRAEVKVVSVRHGVTEINLSEGRLVRATLHIKDVRQNPKVPGTVDISYGIITEILGSSDTPVLDIHETIQ